MIVRTLDYKHSHFTSKIDVKKAKKTNVNGDVSVTVTACSNPLPSATKTWMRIGFSLSAPRCVIVICKCRRYESLNASVLAIMWWVGGGWWGWKGGVFPRMRGSDEHTPIRAYLDAHRFANNARFNRFCSLKSNNCGAHRILAGEYRIQDWDNN